MAKKKKQKTKRLFKDERLYRAYSDIYNFYRSKINEKGISNEDLFLMAIKIELAFCAKNIYLDRFFLTNYLLVPLYLRRAIEAIALYNYFINKNFEPVNLQVFKLYAKGVNVGQKELGDIKKRLMLGKKVDAKKAMENKFLYLSGTSSNEFKFSNIIKEIDLNKLGNFDIDFEKDYLNLSLIIHYSIDEALKNYIVEKYLKKILDKYLNLFDYIFKDELKEISRLNEPLIFSDGPTLIAINKLFGDFSNDISFFSLLISHTSKNPFCADLLHLYYEYIRSFLYLLVNDKYEEIVFSLKTFLEKLSIFGKLLSFDKVEAQKRYDYYLEALTLSLTSTDLDKCFDTEIKNLYEKYKKEFNFKRNIYDFKNLLVTSPSYFIYGKTISFSNEVDFFLTTYCLENKEYLTKLYRYSVGISHCTGYLGFEDEKDFKNAALKVVDFVFKFSRKILKIIQDENKFSIEDIENYSRGYDKIYDDFSETINSLYNIIKDKFNIEEAKDDIEIDFNDGNFLKIFGD